MLPQGQVKDQVAVRISSVPAMPAVSVVIPCCNAERWLESTLFSIQQQAGVRLEVLLVDDGSSDQSCALARRLWQSSPWPLRILSTASQGVSSSRNLGWRAAQHDLIAFLDADDLMLPGRLHAQAALLLREPRLGHCLTGWLRMDPGGRTITEVRPWEEGAGFSLEQALRHKGVLPSAWMFRRTVLEAVGGFDPSLAQAEDVDLLLRLARAGVEGDWVRDCLCGYRVHPQGASRRALAQARGLSFVLERHLRDLPRRGDLTRLASEVRYGTRAWLGWNAWVSGDSALATQLWISALGLSPFPAGLTWVHFAENVVHSAARIGTDPELFNLLSSATWQSLERNWWHRRFRDELLSLHSAFSDPAVDQDLDWSRVFSGDIEAALRTWVRQLQRSIDPTDAAAPFTVDWRPDVMERWCVHTSGLRHLQQRVLRWCVVLLQHCADPSAGRVAWARIRSDLAEILLLWAKVTWPEDRRPTLRRLEQSLAVWASDTTLMALARLHQPTSPAGSLALRQLARAAQPVESPARSLPSMPVPDPAPPDPAQWEQPSAIQDHCAGPQCHPCLAEKLEAWATERGDHELVWWIGSQQVQDPAPELSRNVVRLPGGQAWLRPPMSNPWQSTHAYSVADNCGVVRPDLSRSYPQPWAGFCPHAAGPAEPAPSGTPHRLEGPVLALIGLSAETYYHWLLEVLPTLALLENVLDAQTFSRMRIWHNGGSAPYVWKLCSNAAT
jgi:glycosyltransferase involved in cell wall biosynthesis